MNQSLTKNSQEVKINWIPLHLTHWHLVSRVHLFVQEGSKIQCDCCQLRIKDVKNETSSVFKTEYLMVAPNGHETVVNFHERVLFIHFK